MPVAIFGGMATPNPTDVNSFNGLSDETKTAEVAQSLWDAGAWNADGKPDATQGQKAPEPTPEPVKSQETAETPETETQETPEYADLDDYLTKAGLERDSFLSLPVKLKVDGKDEQATLQELLKAAQLDRHVNQRSQQFAAQQKTWEAERIQARQELANQIQQANALAQLARQQLYGDYQAIDWTKYSAEEQLQIERNFRQRDAQLQQHLSQIQANQQQAVAQQLQAERARMVETIPEWRDEAARTQAQKAISDYASSRGFTPAELSQIIDHRYMRVLNDAVRVQDLQAQVDTLKAQLSGKTSAAVKAVRQAPQAPNPGARITRDPKVAQLQSARERFGKNSRDLNAQADFAQRLLDAGA